MIRKLFIPLLMLVFFATTSKAQDSPLQRPQPKFWVGLSGAASFNFYSGVTQMINSQVYAPTALHDGFGIRPYFSGFMEYRPNPVLGYMFHLGYEDRGAKFDEKIAPCNCPEDLNSKVSYLTLEPSIRIAPFANSFYVFAGPVFSDNFNKSFTYTQVQQPDKSGDFGEMRKWKLGAQVGAGYDIPISKVSSVNQFALSPYISYRPLLGERPRNWGVDSWAMQSVKVGLAIKFGRVLKPKVAEVLPVAVVEVPVVEPEVTFTVISPANVPVQSRIRETMPLRNYIFFDLGSTAIPSRYVLLRKDQVKDFKEDEIEVLTPLVQSDRPKREMLVYYNVLNILGVRMEKNPKTTIVLVGSSMEGPKDGKLMAESVKTYLVDVFGINPKRISIEGRKKPKIASEKPGGKLDLVLLREGDRRVSVESKSPELLMEFQSGPSLQTVEFATVQKAPIDSYVTFNNKGAKEAFSSWSLEIMDEQGRIQNFGPYTEESVSIPGKDILGNRPVGDYKVNMIGQYKSGQVIKKESKVHMVLWTPSTSQEGMRFSVLYEFNTSKSIELYRKYLTDVVAPKIPQGGNVIIHGYTDIIGGEKHNKELSLARANDVKSILEAALIKSGNNNVHFEVLGFGEDESVSQFANKLPEQRFYNRTVIIDINPNK